MESAICEKTLFWINHRLRQPVCTATGLALLISEDEHLPEHLKQLMRELVSQCEKIDLLTQTAVTDALKRISLEKLPPYSH
jgi:hypothetical protein